MKNRDIFFRFSGMVVKYFISGFIKWWIILLYICLVKNVFVLLEIDIEILGVKIWNFLCVV